MAHDVFISHSDIDKNFAVAVCAKLEQHGIRCFLVSRDVRPGGQTMRETSHAIQNCRLVVLVFSRAALSSDTVVSEITLASDCRKVIMPVRIEKVDPAGSFLFLLADVHWLDAMTESGEKNLEQLAVSVRKSLSEKDDTSEEPDDSVQVPPKPPIDPSAGRGGGYASASHAYRSQRLPVTKKPFAKITIALTTVAGLAMLVIVIYLYSLIANYSSDNAPTPVVNGSQHLQKPAETPAALPISGSSASVQAPTSITLSSDPNPAIVGQSVALTATVTSSSPTDGDTVEFHNSDSGRLLGTGILSGGEASCNTDPKNEFTGPGTRNLQADYRGDSNNAPSSSAIYLQNLTAR